MGTIEVDDVERGDILLVTRLEGDPLADLIIELDGSPDDFSHSGIAGGHGTIISSYPSGFEGVRPVDVGGLHHDPFDHFWNKHQRIHRLVLPDDALDRETVLANLDAYPESRETRFGLASIVMVAAALHALLHEDEIGTAGTADIVRSAIRAGEAWTSPDEFFCAEFSATMYDLTSVPFTVGDLRPKGDSRGVEEFARRTLIRLGMTGLLFGREDQEQRDSLGDLVDAIEDHDPAFFDEGVKVLFDEVIYGLGELRSTEELPDDTPVPAALITPRMVAAWGLGTEEIRDPDPASRPRRTTAR